MPKLAHAIRRAGLGICKLARRFTPLNEEQKFLQEFLDRGQKSCQWMDRFNPLTDKEIAVLIGHSIVDKYEEATYEQELLLQSTMRLRRANGTIITQQEEEEDGKVQTGNQDQSGTGSKGMARGSGTQNRIQTTGQKATPQDASEVQKEVRNHGQDSTSGKRA
jgi:hypothetical protein